MLYTHNFGNQNGYAMGEKPLKDIDIVARTQFLNIASWTVPPISFIGFMVGWLMYSSGLIGLVIGGLFGLLTSVIIYFIIEYMGSAGGSILHRGRRPIYSDFDKFEGPLNQARHLKNNNDFDKAYNIANEVLYKAPDLPEALYLCAQILWEGYQDAESSKKHLRKILVLLPDKNETYHRWALSLINDIRSSQD